jgi:hypothetical protein
MTVSLFDILSKLIPGGLLLFAITQSHAINKIEYNEVVVLIIIYILGYFLEAISSIIENPVLFRLFGGNPAVNLLNGRKFLEIGIGRLDKINEIVEEKYKEHKEDKLRLFLIFHSVVSKKEYPRINHFLEQYTLSRNMFVSCLIAGFYYLNCHFTWIGVAVFLLMLAIIFTRTKQRNYYFTKEVINSYLYEKTHKK